MTECVTGITVRDIYVTHIATCVPIKMDELETVRKSYFEDHMDEVDRSDVIRTFSTVVLLLKGPMDRISSLNVYIQDI